MSRRKTEIPKQAKPIKYIFLSAPHACKHRVKKATFGVKVRSRVTTGDSGESHSHRVKTSVYVL